jgi:thymidylate synthase (FAD)
VEVSLLRITPECEDLIAESARICYASQPKSRDANKRLLENLRGWGHMSTFEHSSATFLISGVSRACTHQLVRHRIASYSQQSQRYVKEDGFEYVTPPSIMGNQDLREKYDSAIGEIRKHYRMLLDSGIPKEDARFILPNACSTKIAVTMNFRELRHFIKLRSGEAAQWEIRQLALKMLELLMERAPNAFGDLKK